MNILQFDWVHQNPGTLYVLYRGSTHAHEVILVHVCTDEWFPMHGQYTLSPSVFPEKSAGGKPSHIYAQSEAQIDHPKKISDYGGYFERFTYRVTVPRQATWLKELDDEQFSFQVCHFKSYYTLQLLLQSGAGSISCSIYLDAPNTDWSRHLVFGPSLHRAMSYATTSPSTMDRVIKNVISWLRTPQNCRPPEQL